MELIIVAVVVYLVFRGLQPRCGTASTAPQLVGWVPDTKWRVVAPLARTDLRLVLRHPAFVVGVLVTPLMLFAATESVSSWRQASAGIALGLVPLGWLTIIAVNLVTLRPRRTGTEELFAALPAPQPVRTTAMLSAAIGPVIAAAILAAAWVLVVGSREEVRGSPRWAEIAAGVLIVAGSVCVGVAVARWLPNPGFGVLAVVVTIVIQARFLDVTTWPWNRSEGDPLRFLGFLASPTSVTDDFLELRPSGWHLAVPRRSRRSHGRHRPRPRGNASPGRDRRRCRRPRRGDRRMDADPSLVSRAAGCDGVVSRRTRRPSDL